MTEMAARLKGAFASRVVLTDEDFRELSGLFREWCGIRMPPAKRSLLEGRLRKRLAVLGLTSYSRYREYLLTPGGQREEMAHAIDAITTNKTDFFREAKHFDFLVEEALPKVMCLDAAGSRRRINAWSAGCSTGEEPYTLAMVLGEHAEKVPGFSFGILATDVSTRALEIARRGVYDVERVKPVPFELRRKYLMRSRDRGRDLVRIVPELRSRIQFHRLNFMDGTFNLAEPMHVVFFRNVLIYFDRATQERVVRNICHHLIPGGYLFTGHSETLHGLDLPLVWTAATAYRRI